jgi:hypothetical protein
LKMSNLKCLTVSSERWNVNKFNEKSETSTENYKTWLREIKEDLNRHSLFMAWKTQYNQGKNLSQIDLKL